MNRKEIPSYITFEGVTEDIANDAYCLSQFRKIKKCDKTLLEIIANTHSTVEEMEDDWYQASIRCVLAFLKRQRSLTGLTSDCYIVFESVWLDDVKKLIAYYKSLKSPLESIDETYFNATKEIRSFLFNTQSVGSKSFNDVKNYLNANYLTNGKFDEKKENAHKLIKRKAERLYRSTGIDNKEYNWSRAKYFIELFYDNIIPAVLGDEKCLARVLKAFGFGKYKQNGFFVINSFEAAIAIFYLDKEKLKKVIGDPQSFVFSISLLNEQWQTDKIVSDKNFEYNEGTKWITYKGVMKDSERDKLLKTFDERNYHNKIKELYYQSNITPSEDGIL